METARQSNPQPKTEPVNDVAAPARKPEAPAAAKPGDGAPQTAVKRSRTRRPFLILGAVAVIVLLVVGVYSLMTAGREDTDDAQVAADVVPVAARVGGVVLRVGIVENQRVHGGDLLIELDPADYLARVQQAEADVANAEAQSSAADAQVTIVDATSKGGLVSARAALSGSAAGVGSADAQLAASRAAAARAEADLRKAEIDFARARTLRQSDAVPQERLDTAQVALESARAAKSQAEAQVALAEDTRRGAISRVAEARGHVNQSTPVAPQIASARAGAALAAARVAGARAALSLARLQLSYTKIMAPTDGFASKLTAHVGQLVSMGQPVIELVPASTYVVANFKETQVGSMRPGQPATIDVDAYGGRKLHGRVESLAGGTGAAFSLLPPDNATGNFVKVVQRVPVRIAWTDLPADVVMRPGLSADVTVDVRH